MKKMLTIVSVVLMMAMLFSFSAFAADVNSPGGTDLALTATVDGATSYVISIPTTATVNMAAGEQSVGAVICTSYTSNEGATISVAAAQKTAMTNGLHTVNFTVNPAAAMTFNAVSVDDGTDVKITLGDLTGLIAGTYTGAITFTVSVN